MAHATTQICDQHSLVVDIKPEPGETSIGRTSSSLLSLPAELRYYIWQLVFTPDNDEVDLSTTRGPNSSLLLVSHQIQHEAIKLYHEACELFWSTTRFFLERGSICHGKCKGCSHCTLDNISDNVVQKIGHITIRGSEKHRYVFEKGIWSCTCTIPSQDGARRYPFDCSHLAINSDTRIANEIVDSLRQQRCYVFAKRLDNKTSYCLNLRSGTSEEHVKLAKKLLEWESLTKNQLRGMMARYKQKY